MILQLGESIIYGDNYRSSLRNCVSARKGILEFVEYPSVKQELDNCLAQLEAEHVTATAALPNSTGAGSTDDGDDDETPSTVVVGPEAVKISATVEALADDSRKAIDTELDRHVRAYCSFNVYPSVITDLKGMTEASELARQAGDAHGFAMILFNADTWTEASSQPRSRKPPVPDKLYEKVVGAIVMGRYRGEDVVDAALNEGDLVCCLDGSRPGLANRLMKPWLKGLSKGKQGANDEDDVEGDGDADGGEAEVKKKGYCMRKLDVFLAESSVKARKGKVRGTACLSQCFRAHMISKTPISLPERTCAVYADQSNRGTAIGPVILPKPEEEWQGTRAQKKLLYGSWRILVGGRGPAVDNEKAEGSKEPVFFNSLPPPFFEALFKRFFVKFVYDLTPGSGGAAIACAKNRIGYFCLCMSDPHAQQLRSMTRDAVLAEMKTAGSPIFNAKVAGIMNPTKPKPNNKPNDETKKPRGRKRDGDGAGGPEPQPENKKPRPASAKVAPSRPKAKKATRKATPDEGHDDDGAMSDLTDASDWDLDDDEEED